MRERVITVLVLVAAAAPPARAQPDWLPPEVRHPQPARSPAGTPSPFDLVGPEADDPCGDPLLAPIAPPVRDTGFDRAIDP